MAVTIQTAQKITNEAIHSLDERSISRPAEDQQNRIRRSVNCTDRNICRHPDAVICDYIPQKYGYIFRPKTWLELIQIGSVVCGIELCLAAETAFVTPILLSLGLDIKFVSMTWCLTPILWFFGSPLLGSLSDSCKSRFGRRRPFILLLSVGVLIGLIFILHGHRIGISLGDVPNLRTYTNTSKVSNGTLMSSMNTKYIMKETLQAKNELLFGNIIHSSGNINFTSKQHSLETRFPEPEVENGFTNNQVVKENFAVEASDRSEMILSSSQSSEGQLQPWSISFVVIGAALLDFSADSCHCPARAYLLEVSLPDDHITGLSTFTIIGGFGGVIGSLMGAFHWERSYSQHSLEDQVTTVFTIVIIVFILCLTATLCSFPEIPLPVLKDPNIFKEFQQKLQTGQFQKKENEFEMTDSNIKNYRCMSKCGEDSIEMESSVVDPSDTNEKLQTSVLKTNTDNQNIRGELNEIDPSITPLTAEQQPTFREYLRSIIYMPKSLRILCLTNVFCWISFLCYQLYFTDFVGQVIYGGNPQAPVDSESYKLYNDGVRFGCWGMALFSLSCSMYSCFIETLVKRLGAKPVYIGSQLVFSTGMFVMAVTQHPVSAIILSSTAGVMYATLFSIPYLLIGHYHNMQKFHDDKNTGEAGIRGVGTDIMIVRGIVSVPQAVLSLSVGSIAEGVGSNVATVYAAAILSACGAFCATQVMYLDL